MEEDEISDCCQERAIWEEVDGGVYYGWICSKCGEACELEIVD